MQYFLVLGSHSSLATAEALTALTPDTARNVRLVGSVLLFETRQEIDPVELMGRLGGTIKAGRVISTDLDRDPEKLSAFMSTEAKRRSENEKAVFGYSLYASSERRAEQLSRRFRKVGMETKRLLRESGLSVRWVKPQKGSDLSSVSVSKNGLLNAGGCELVLLELGKQEPLLAGLTVAVQPFERFSALDYGRPDRNARQGMLPPKLARMMVNLSMPAEKRTLWDPFCGSGTILSEALQLGVREVYGSDRDQRAVSAAQNNLDWVKEQTHLKCKATFFVSDATEPTKEIPDGEVEIVVSEPYLGPPRNGQERRPELYRRLEELTKLYGRSILACSNKLTDRTKIVLALPVYLDEKRDRLGVDLDKIMPEGFRQDSLLASDLLDRNQTGPNGGLLYGRPGQFVWREVVRLKKT